MPKVRSILFDLSEVLIAGLLGVEVELAGRMGLSETECLARFGGERLWDLCRGRLSEDEYVNAAIAGCPDLSPDDAKRVIRNNFHRKVDGMEPLLRDLAANYDLHLISDHAREWVDYIRSVHPFLATFKSTHFSCDTGRTKADAQTFTDLLAGLGLPAGTCLFIDDSANNIAQARIAGLHSIQFIGAQHLRRELISLGLLHT